MSGNWGGKSLTHPLTPTGIFRGKHDMDKTAHRAGYFSILRPFPVLSSRAKPRDLDLLGPPAT